MPRSHSRQRSSGSLSRVSGNSTKRPVAGIVAANTTIAARPNRLPTSATAPNARSPAVAPKTPTAISHPITEARTEVGNSSLVSAPAAGAKVAVYGLPKGDGTLNAYWVNLFD